MNVERLFAQYQASTEEAARQTLVGVMEPHTRELCAYLARAYRDLSPRGVSYCLSQLSRKEKWQAELCALAEGNPALVEWLYRADAKTRKNLYIWLGACPTGMGAALLAKAAGEEGTFFAVPSLLLAIGKSGGRRESLEQVMTRMAGEEIPPKIRAEIEDAYRLASDRLADKGGKVEVRLTEPRSFLLTTAPHLHGVLREEIGDLTPIEREVEEGLVVKTADVGGLYAYRCFYEAALFDPDLYDVAWAELPLRLARALEHIDLNAMHGADEVRYRVSVKAKVDKRSVVSAIVGALKERRGLVNSPSNYQVELIVTGGDKARCVIKLCGVEDDRYAYRVEALPASINPTTAAVIARLARRYVKDPKRILDGFCGTSTMLVEAGKVYPAASLTGVDITKEAVDKSAVNAEAAGVKIDLVQSDILRYKPKAPFDLVLGNMPYGNRVGTHESNVRLYKGLLDRLPELCDGFAFLLTTEIALLKGLIMQAEGVTLVRMYTLPAGGLTPTLFVVKVSER
ncbi:MAG: methyltransferase domain-containing protein [Clostridia bacterium]|nr:methyltransferase domain-containing protein [Clostridia bacterium]